MAQPSAEWPNQNKENPKARQGHPPIASALQNWQVGEGVPSADLSAAPAVGTKAARHHAVYMDDGPIDQPYAGVEIEGEATVVVEPTPVPPVVEHSKETPAPDQPSLIEDLLDPAIVITLQERHLALRPGEEGAYQLTILNNGTERADFRVTVEGWIDERWLTDPPPQIVLAPGERRQITVTLALPQQPMPRAGTYGVAIVVREFGTRVTHYGTRMSRCGATLRILPHTALQLYKVQPAPLALSWWHQDHQAMIPLSNHSNHPVAVRLHVRQAQGAPCVWSILAGTTATTTSQDSSTTILLRPGQQRKVALRVHLQTHPLFGVRPTTALLQLVATSVATSGNGEYKPAADGPVATDAVNSFPEKVAAVHTGHSSWQASTAVAINAKPLIGIWQITSFVTLLLVAAMGMGLAGLTALLLFGLNAQSVEPAPQPIQSMAAQPIIVAYIQAPIDRAQVNQGSVQVDSTEQMAGVPQVSQADVSSPNISSPNISSPNRGVAVTTGDALPTVAIVPGPLGATEGGIVAETALRDGAGALPVLQPEQITAPGAPVPTPITASLPPATPAPMTYATMFREIAHRYDLNWRVLAAQAYVESGFDTVALGAHGDLGLMQVLPGTWHEWAPTVDASDPFDSYSNVLVAAAYLDYLRSTLSRRGHPEIEWTLVAYNSGIDKVLQHIESGRGWQELEASRRNYATEILRLAGTIPAE